MDVFRVGGGFSISTAAAEDAVEGKPWPLGRPALATGADIIGGDILEGGVGGDEGSVDRKPGSRRTASGSGPMDSALGLCAGPFGLPFE